MRHTFLFHIILSNIYKDKDKYIYIYTHTQRCHVPSQIYNINAPTILITETIITKIKFRMRKSSDHIHKLNWVLSIRHEVNGIEEKPNYIYIHISLAEKKYHKFNFPRIEN